MEDAHSSSRATDYVPRLFLTKDFLPYKDRLERLPHVERTFKRGERLWKLGDYIDRVYYIETGVVQANVVHENGHEKLIWFVGNGSVYPGCHETQFRIEKSIEAVAFFDTQALEFPRAQFREAVLHDPELASAELEFYAKMINIGLYDTAHQEYNDAFTRVCNLLYLLSIGDLATPGHIINSQKGLSDMLGIERANVARHLSRLAKEGIIKTHRGWVEIVDSDALLSYCSYETMGN